jgi:hypothetical protein
LYRRLQKRADVTAEGVQSLRPKDQDAQAFYEIAHKAQVSYPIKLRLCYVEFPLGHNDVTVVPWWLDDDRGVGAVVVAMLVRAFAGHQMIRPRRSTTFTK